jgi:hypothetical protein
VADQWKQGVGGLVRRYRRRIAGGIERGVALLPWTDEPVHSDMDGFEHDFDAAFDLNEFDEFPSTDGSLTGGSTPGRDGDDDELPIDLQALRSDDELLDALGGTGSHPEFAATARYGGEAELVSLLRAWRDEAEHDPIPMMYDTEAAVEVISQAAIDRRRPRRWLVPVASAAAVVVIGFTSLGVVARDAQPGSPLWGLTQVLYADHAKSVEAAVTVRDELSHASVAMQEGHFTEARTALSLAQNSLPSVDSSDGRADLLARGQQLAQQLGANGLEPPSSVTVTGIPSITSPVPTTTSPIPVTTTPSSPVTTPTSPSSPVSTPPTTDSSVPSSDSQAGPGTVTTDPQTDSQKTVQAPAGNQSGTG